MPEEEINIILFFKFYFDFLLCVCVCVCVNVTYTNILSHNYASGCVEIWSDIFFPILVGRLCKTRET